MLKQMLKSISRFAWADTPDSYHRASPLILINGLAEQGESWYSNRDAWQQHFDVHLPGLLVYGGAVLQERLQKKEPINVEFLTNRLADYLDNYVQAPPYHLVASSLGGQIAIEFASRRPEQVNHLVLICPSGMGSEERLPITEGARHKDYRGLVESTFYDRRLASPRVIQYYEQKFQSKHWRRALFETVRGTKSHSVRDKLRLIDRPTLVICGREDRIVDSRVVQTAVEELPNYRLVMIPKCGHAPQLEHPRLVNQLVLDFLKGSSALKLAGGCSCTQQVGIAVGGN
jgi:pimeloyl-ACP methyl ester carboxylesterase